MGKGTPIVATPFFSNNSTIILNTYFGYPIY